MDDAVMQRVLGVVYVALALAALVQWRRHRDSASAWMAATLTVLALVLVAGEFIPDAEHHDDISAASLWVRKFNIVVLALFPYCLLRFTRSFQRPGRYMPPVAHGLLLTVVVWALALPYLPGTEEESNPWWYDAFVLVFVAYWTLLSVVVVRRLVRTGRAQPPVARKRMRLLAGGAVAINLALLVAALGASTDDPRVQVVTRLLALTSALLFFMGFVPPALLRAVWRRRIEDRFREVETGLMGAVTVAAVVDAMLPFVAEYFGGRGAVLTDASGAVLGAHGMSDDEARDFVAEWSEDGGVAGPEVVAVDVRGGTLAVRGSAYTPYFGTDELQLLQLLGSFTALALERAELFALERDARVDLQRTHSELEALVYGVSHDLKSPIISLLGYADYLIADHGDQLQGDARFFVDRMVASTQYMKQLLDDLLELSRISRVQADAERVDLGGLVREVAGDVTVNFPQATIDVRPLPTVLMNPRQARQLFGNLITNALRHGGREDITVSVASSPTDDGGAVIVVEDDGRGIPTKYREKAFGIFERLDTGGEAGGTGIGLAITRKIVELAGGSITIADSAVGAKFEITLPSNAVIAGALTNQEVGA